MKRGCDLLILFLQIKIKRSQRAAAPTGIARNPANNPDGCIVFQATDAFASRLAPTGDLCLSHLQCGSEPAREEAESVAA